MDDQQTPPPEPVKQEIIEPQKTQRSKSTPGRKPHERTKAFANMVSVLSGMKWSRVQIAAVLEVSDQTIHRHYEHEFQHGRDIVRAKVSMTLMELLDAKDARIAIYLSEQLDCLGNAETAPALKQQLQITALTPEEAQRQYEEAIKG